MGCGLWCVTRETRGGGELDRGGGCGRTRGVSEEDRRDEGRHLEREVKKSGGGNSSIAYKSRIVVTWERGWMVDRSKSTSSESKVRRQVRTTSLESRD